MGCYPQESCSLLCWLLTVDFSAREEGPHSGLHAKEGRSRAGLTAREERSRPGLHAKERGVLAEGWLREKRVLGMGWLWDRRGLALCGLQNSRAELSGWPVNHTVVDLLTAYSEHGENYQKSETIISHHTCQVHALFRLTGFVFIYFNVE